MYYLGEEITKFMYNGEEITVMYCNGAIIYQSGGDSKLCYAVVDDISLYTDRTFEDVYDKKTEKWYKLNNLKNYEEYGIYANSFATNYNGKLAIVPEGDILVDYEVGSVTFDSKEAHFLTNVTPTTSTGFEVDFTTPSVFDVNKFLIGARNHSGNVFTPGSNLAILSNGSLRIDMGNTTISTDTFTFETNTRYKVKVKKVALTGLDYVYTVTAEDGQILKEATFSVGSTAGTIGVAYAIGGINQTEGIQAGAGCEGCTIHGVQIWPISSMPIANTYKFGKRADKDEIYFLQSSSLKNVIDSTNTGITYTKGEGVITIPIASDKTFEYEYQKNKWVNIGEAGEVGGWSGISKDFDRSIPISSIQYKPVTITGEGQGFFSEFPNINLDGAVWNAATTAAKGYGTYHRFNTSYNGGVYTNNFTHSTTADTKITTLTNMGDGWYELNLGTNVLYWGGAYQTSTFPYYSVKVYYMMKQYAKEYEEKEAPISIDTVATLEELNNYDKCRYEGLMVICLEDGKLYTCQADGSWDNGMPVQGNRVINYTSTDGKVIEPNAGRLVNYVTSIYTEDGGKIIGSEDFTAINGSAFTNSTRLKTITLPDSITDIGSGAFASATTLNNIVFSKNLKNIYGFAFRNTPNLSSVTIPDSVTTINGNAFEYNRGLKKVVIGSGVTSIGSYAFGAGISTYASITEVTFRSRTAPSFGTNTFRYQESKVATVHVPISWTKTDVNTMISKALWNSKVDIYPVKDTGVVVTSLPTGAFSGITAITSVTIPDTVTSIGSNAFSGCGLTKVTYEGTLAQWESISKGINCFPEVLRVVHCTDGDILLIYDYLSTYADGSVKKEDVISDKANLVSVEITSAATSIGYGAFDSCSKLTSVIIPDSVTSIDGTAFFICRSLTSVTIPDSVTSIGMYAFSNCSSLTSATIGSGVTSIGNYAFNVCSKLSSITFAGLIPTFGTTPFSGIKSTGTAYVPNAWSEDEIAILRTYLPSGWNVEYSGVDVPYNYSSTYSNGIVRHENTISDKANLVSVEITSAVTNIQASAFTSCTNLTSATIPDSVTSIGGYAFSACTSLTSATIPDSVTSINRSAFGKCTGLTSMIIPDSVTSIGYGAFQSCSSLTSITIGNSVTIIDSYAIYNCTSLTSITIPDSVTSIGSYAFQYCSSLADITMTNDDFSKGSMVFNGVSPTGTLHIPEGGDFENVIEELENWTIEYYEEHHEKE